MRVTTFSISERVKFSLRKLLYNVGALGCLHRYRNANTLTTFMFHRVLPRDSQEYTIAEKEFTLSTEGFSKCLSFIQKHYNVVSLGYIENQWKSGGTLPPCAGLITFDDGWLDTLEFAAEELAHRKLTGLVFVTSDVLNSKSDFWWQDALVIILSDPLKAEALATELKISFSLDLLRTKNFIYEVTAILATLPEDKRTEVLRISGFTYVCGRQMLRQSDTKNIDWSVLELGAHGFSHAPMTKLSNATSELKISLDTILALGGRASMSFPHGDYNQYLLELAGNTGYTTVFTSDSYLTPTPIRPNQGRPLGRIHIPENEWTCHDGEISFPQLATFLFFRPISKFETNVPT